MANRYSHELKNSYKLCALMISEGTQKIRERLSQAVRNKYGKNFSDVLKLPKIRKQFNGLRNSNIITHQQFDLWYPEDGNVTLLNLDIPLLTLTCIELKLLNTSHDWCGAPAEQDISLSADLLRLYNFRNSLCNRNGTCKPVGNINYLNILTEIKEILQRLTVDDDTIEDWSNRDLSPEECDWYGQVMIKAKTNDEHLRIYLESLSRICYFPEHNLFIPLLIVLVVLSIVYPRNTEPKLPVETTEITINGEELFQVELSKILLVKNLRHFYQQHHQYIQKKPWINGDYISINDAFINLEFNESQHFRKFHVSNKKYENYNEIFIDDNVKSKRYVIIGVAGQGKTTLAKKMAYDWAVQDKGMAKFEYVFLIYARELLISETVLDHIMKKVVFHEKSIYENTIDNLLLCSKSLLIIDGLDEARDTSEYSDLMLLIYGFKYPNLHVVVTTRPHILPLLYLQPKTALSHFNIVGFTNKQILKYINMYFSYELSGYQLDYIESSIDKARLWSTMRNPLCTLLVCYIWETFGEIPDSRTDIFMELMHIFEVNYKTKGYKNKWETIQYQLGHLAFDNLFHKDAKLIFSLEDLLIKEISPTVANESGLLHRVESYWKPDNHRVIESSGNNWYSFIHKSIQELCAALYVHTRVLHGNMREVNKLKEYISSPNSMISLEIFLEFLSSLGLKHDEKITAGYLIVLNLNRIFYECFVENGHFKFYESNGGSVISSVSEIMLQWMIKEKITLRDIQNICIWKKPSGIIDILEIYNKELNIAPHRGAKSAPHRSVTLNSLLVLGENADSMSITGLLKLIYLNSETNYITILYPYIDINPSKILDLTEVIKNVQSITKARNLFIQVFRNRLLIRNGCVKVLILSYESFESAPSTNKYIANECMSCIEEFEHNYLNQDVPVLINQLQNWKSLKKLRLPFVDLYNKGTTLVQEVSPDITELILRDCKLDDASIVSIIQKIGEWNHIEKVYISYMDTLFHLKFDYNEKGYNLHLKFVSQEVVNEFIELLGNLQNVIELDVVDVNFGNKVGDLMGAIPNSISTLKMSCPQFHIIYKYLQEWTRLEYMELFKFLQTDCTLKIDKIGMFSIYCPDHSLTKINTEALIPFINGIKDFDEVSLLNIDLSDIGDQLISSLPFSIKVLKLKNTKIGEIYLTSLTKYISKCTGITKLELADDSIDNRLPDLVRAIPESIKELQLSIKTKLMSESYMATLEQTSRWTHDTKIRLDFQPSISQVLILSYKSEVSSSFYWTLKSNTRPSYQRNFDYWNLGNIVKVLLLTFTDSITVLVAHGPTLSYSQTEVLNSDLVVFL